MSSGLGIKPEYVMHCESGFVQKFVTGHVWLSCSCKLENSLAGRSAGHEHQAAGNRIQRRAEVHYTYISRVKSPYNVCRGSVEECNQAHAGVHRSRHKADRLMTRCTEAALSGYLYVLCPQSGCVKKPPVH